MEGLLMLDCLQWVVVKKSAEGGLVMGELTAELTLFLSPSHLPECFIRTKVLTVKQSPGLESRQR